MKNFVTTDLPNALLCHCLWRTGHWSIHKETPSAKHWAPSEGYAHQRLLHYHLRNATPLCGSPCAEEFSAKHPQKKTQSIGIDLLLEGDFLRIVVHFFVSKHVHSMNLLYLQIDGDSTPTSKFFVIKIISNAFCRQKIPLGSLRAIKLETATAGARWPPWGFWWLSAWCFSCQFLINNPFPRGCLGEQKRRKFPLVQWWWKHLGDDWHVCDRKTFTKMCKL